MSVWRLVRHYGLLVLTLLYGLLVFVSMYDGIFAVILERAFFTGTVVLLCVVGLLVMSVIALVRGAMVEPGAPPSWLRADRVDAFVRDELQRIATTHRPPPPPRDDGEDDDDAAATTQRAAATLQQGQQHNVADERDVDRHTSANAKMYTLLSQRMREAAVEDSVDVPVLNTPSPGTAATTVTAATRAQAALPSDAEAEGASDAPDNAPAAAAAGGAAGDARSYSKSNSASNATDKLPLDVPDKMDMRRQRKRRHGLPVLTTSQLARVALQALDADAETREHEMTFLLRGARVCRLCGVYNLLDTVHCNSCERCVLQRDQHNYLLGQCVGRDTHKYYVLCLLYMLLAMLLVTTCSIVTIYLHWAVIYSPTAYDDVKTWFVLCTIVAVTFGLLMGILLWAQVLAVGKAESSDAADRRAEREWEEQFARRVTIHGFYRPLTTGEEDMHAAAPQPFSLRNLRRVFGDGAPSVHWLLPSPPRRATAAAEEHAFWAAMRARIELQLRGAADLPSDAERNDDDTAIVAVAPAPGTTGAATHVGAAAGAGADGADAGDGGYTDFLERCNMPAPSVAATTGGRAVAATRVQQQPRDGDDGVALDVAGPLARLSSH